ncbi:hypothetical protein BO94DRAFT_63427 [Aspergillus sclerotioniger CBS 115572]|uniref:Heterokaryon incompatibility domain-containing protein n=1 Tax=Aspergillus sclerotioniger CBS 115572 TaxID=1450535 RepID=A0A317WNJ9_9EURO|nr:hypothetical protein BO94DRAFT_63427 [Aspergillus sclerotioniger CBS 115572]PWY88049.1 hypothetical protein BO94DRAFT_63427 [Aspergillus sclerotioniger CBS 115572]
MDHLILPKDSTGLRFEIPVLSTENYDGGDFLTYPNRQGWGPRRVSEWQTVFEKPSVEFKAFLQRWLYFGLVHVRFGPIDVKSTFASEKRDEYGRPILTTKLLPKIALHSIKSSRRANSFHGAVAVRIADTISVRLTGTWVVKRDNPQQLEDVESLMQFITSEGPADPRDPFDSLATTLLYDFSNVSSQWTPSGPSNISNGGLPPRVAPMSPDIWTILRQRGWCPSAILPMAKHLTSSALVFVANMTSPNAGRQHRMINITGSGGSPLPKDELCNELSCPHLKLSDDTYKTRHLDGCLGCEDIVADPTAIFRRRKFPLIMAIDADNEDTGVTLVEMESNVSYIAISHVWSDGLGNVQRNALPRCQLLRLSDMVRNLPGEAANTTLFWLDTLCMPPDAADQKEEQYTALQLMRQVYEDASAVLVLDSWLMSISCYQIDDAELMMSIFTATWNRRLWTYQEGALARMLLFRFQDGTCDLDSMFKRYENALDITASTTLWTCFDVKYRGLKRVPSYLESEGCSCRSNGCYDFSKYKPSCGRSALPGSTSQSRLTAHTSSERGVL